MCVPSAPAMPAPPPPPEIPQAPQRQDSSVLAARQAARAKGIAQNGYASTILTGGRGVNGGGFATGKSDNSGSILTANPKSVELKRNNPALEMDYARSFENRK